MSLPPPAELATALDALDAHALRLVLRATLAQTGAALFDATVRDLAELLGTASVILGELRPGPAATVRSLAMWSDGAPAPPFDYALAGTPCEAVVADGICYVATDAAVRYPRDEALRLLRASSYLGTALRDGDEVIGVLAVLHEATIPDTPRARAALAIFARRAAAELRRLRLDRVATERAEALLRYRSTLLDLVRDDGSDAEASLRRLLRTASETMGVARVSYWSLCADASRIDCVQLYESTTGEYSGGAVLRARDYPAYFAALLSTRVIAADDARTDPRTAEFTRSYFEPTGIRSMLDVPVWQQGRLAGVLCHEATGEVRSWTGGEADFAVGLAGIVAVGLEAAERRRVEERFDRIAHVTNDVLYDWDIRTGALHFSDGIRAVLGYPTGSTEPRIAWWIEHIHPDDRDPTWADLHAALAGTATTWQGEYRFQSYASGYATVIDRGFVMRDEAGVAVRMVGAMIDVTERRAMEARLLLADRMASVGTLAAGVAHEINTPLAYILANLDYALESLRAGRAPRADVLDALSDSREGALRVRAIVRDLRTFSRTDDEDRGPVDLRRVIESTVNMAWNEIRHRARLVKDYKPVPLIAGNEARLGQVVLNLVINAAQAIPEGAVDRNEIRILTYTDPAGRGVLEVHDTGPGIPPDLRARVFDPFFTTKPIGLGTGLGLSICHSIVTSLGGEITLENAPDGGCLVRVTLRSAALEAAPQAIAPAPPPPPPPPAPRRTVLVIDDDEHLTTAIRRMLASVADVVVATSARDGFTALHARPIDVVLCDLMMPDMTGMDFHAELAASDPARAARVIFMTGGAFTERAQAFLARVPNARIDKPLDVALLRALVLA